MKPDTSAERLAAIQAHCKRIDQRDDEWVPGYIHRERDLLAMLDARDREIVALREVVQSLQQEGAGRVRYD